MKSVEMFCSQSCPNGCDCGLGVRQGNPDCITSINTECKDAGRNATDLEALKNDEVFVYDKEEMIGFVRHGVLNILP